jgi:hypothetical protein
MRGGLPVSLRIALCSGALALGTAACGTPEALPPQIYQVWRNPDPAYRDRYFELREGWVIFGTGSYTSTMYPIQGIDVERAGIRTEFNIEYLADDGALVPLRIVYTPGPPAQLQLGSRRDTWVPESAAPRPKGGSS